VSQDRNPNVTLGQQGVIRETQLPEVQLSEQLAAVRDRILGAFADGGAAEWPVSGFRGELTVGVPAARIVDVLAFCRDDEEVRCELLADLSGVHWPGGTVEAHPEETTGWPTYAEERSGTIELDYVLYSLTHNHRFRLRATLPDDGPRIASAVPVYRSAHIMEREVYDFFGVVFDGHPNLTRIEMPDDWVGHPHRKDYPLGGVEVQYKGATVPPPDERRY
jgi:NADH-quinone oxidoreductase subunit C